VFSNLFFITLPNIGKYFSGIHFPWNSLSKKKLLSSKQTGPYFSLHYQISENTFPEFTFPGIHFPKKNYFPVNKRGPKLR